MAFSEPNSETDRAMFSEHQWALASPNAELAMGGARATASDYEAAFAIERVHIFHEEGGHSLSRTCVQRSQPGMALLLRLRVLRKCD